jgi:hypothetical protein
MTSAWGLSWGSSWAKSWGGGVPPAVGPVRQPGGFLPPRRPRHIIYLDRDGRPVDLKTYKARMVNEAVQTARNTVKRLPKEDKPEAAERLRRLREALADGVVEHIVARSREMAEKVTALRRLVAELERIAAQEFEQGQRDDEAAIVLLLIA